MLQSRAYRLSSETHRCFSSENSNQHLPVNTGEPAVRLCRAQEAPLRLENSNTRRAICSFGFPNDASLPAKKEAGTRCRGIT